MSICKGHECGRNVTDGDLCAYCLEMPQHKPYKFVIQAVVQVADADGNVIGETSCEPVVVFGCDNLAKWAERFPEQLAAAATVTG